MEDYAVIESVGDLLKYALPIDDDRYPTWYRGQTNAAWTLAPKIWRRPPFEGTRDSECLVAESFRTRAGTRTERPPDTNDIGRWLALMQHYGAPTRLLDWSESPLVAAYFAVTDQPGEPPSDSDAAIFSLFPRTLNLHHNITDGVVSLGRPPALIMDAFGGPDYFPGLPDFVYQVASTYKVVAATGDEVGGRQTAQACAFTVHSFRCTDLFDLPDVGNWVRRLRIPKERKGDIRRELTALGIVRMRLFPDLHVLGEWLADSVRLRPGVTP